MSIEYNGSYGPSSQNPPYNAFNPFSYAVFTGASMTSDGDVLTMATLYSTVGVWFGRNGEGHGTWGMGPNSQGSYVGIRSKLGTTAKQWSFYFTDGTGYAWFEFNPSLLDNDRLQWATNTATPQADLDLQQFNTFEIWLKSGQVAYAVNGQLLYAGASALSSSNVLVIGDGSGSTVSGTGSMQVDWVSIRTGLDYASAPAIPSGVPEPASVALVSFAGLAGIAMQRRARATRLIADK